MRATGPTAGEVEPGVTARPRPGPHIRGVRVGELCRRARIVVMVVGVACHWGLSSCTQPTGPACARLVPKTLEVAPWQSPFSFGRPCWRLGPALFSPLPGFGFFAGRGRRYSSSK